MSAAAISVNLDLVQAVVKKQFPQYSTLPITPVVPQGWDNRTFRLGSELSVRLPSAARYEPQTLKEWEWLPHLAPNLPLPVPTPVNLGKPDKIFPWHWSIRSWLTGAPATTAIPTSPSEFARALGGFLLALRSVPASGGPVPGTHNFHRGASPAVYDRETHIALRALDSHIDTDKAARIWNEATAAEYTDDAVWLHGDMSPGNLLVQTGELAAVLDFGCCAVGDPACDLTIAWTYFEGESRRAFRDAVDVDESTWKRARGWALWKAAILQARIAETNAVTPERNAAILRDVMTDPIV